MARINPTASPDVPSNNAENGAINPNSSPGTLDVPTNARRVGAPMGNQNNLQHGAYSREIERAKKRRLRGNAKRAALETLAAVLREQGNPDDIPVTLQFVCRRFSRRVGWLHRMDRAVDGLIRKNPRLRENPKALAALYDLTRPVESDAINDAKTIGFERVTKDGDLAPWEMDDPEPRETANSEAAEPRDKEIDRELAQ